ncbi:MAG: phenylalanine--tRNA ligase subunit alpha [Candidatus Woesebacteria bacterium]|nr:MAG: phenylalanine--tRNA ligase subunit alpha [Candidatus Woesebacteria bacterium]
MQTKQIYYEDEYKKTLEAKVISIEKYDSMANIILDQTIFYPEGGGQPSDQGVIRGKSGSLEVQQTIIKNGEVVHIGRLVGNLVENEVVECNIDWDRRYKNMRTHSAGHIVNDAVQTLFPALIPVEAEHGKKSFIKYQGNLSQISSTIILEKANEIINENLPIKTEFVSFDELKKRATWIPENLPKSKPLRIMQIGNYSIIPDGGTQVKKTGEIIRISEINVTNKDIYVYIHYKIESIPEHPEVENKNLDSNISYSSYNSNDIINTKNQAIAQISGAKDNEELEQIRIDLFGRNGKITNILKGIKNVPQDQRQQIGILINETKKTLEGMLLDQKNSFKENAREWFDPTIPGIKKEVGHAHLVTQAINQIQSVFERIGFRRARYPEVEWDWFAFEALNMPKGHPARDEWETFFVNNPENSRFGKMVLTPHTSSGQVREMQRLKVPPIRMINIAKCYRRQSDISHVQMFHQFEGMVIDENISIVNLKGTLDYFAQTFFGSTRKTRLRPYHFQFTEPSFEIDISCGICNGVGCKVCKAGWLEMGGAGMVHPNVLKAGGVNPKKYSGFAFGWGVERVLMMQSGLAIPDVRMIYSPDLRFLTQF